MSRSAVVETHAKDQAKGTRPSNGADSVLLEILRFAASLKWTVWLCVLATFLVFFGTLAQVDQGIWHVVTKYFRSIIVWVPFAIFFPRSWAVPGAFPFPGGWLIGGLLLFNMIAAMILRFRLKWQHAGLLLTHFGLVVLIVGQFFVGLTAVEGNMVIEEGGWSNYLQHTRQIELAVIQPVDERHEDHVVVPGNLLARGGTISHQLLPFDIKIERFMPDVDIRPVHNKDHNIATAGLGLEWEAIPARKRPGADRDLSLPAVYATFLEKGSGKPLGTYLLSVWFTYPTDQGAPQVVELDGTKYIVQLRFKRSYKPYTIHLIDFRHEKYPGTDIPKDFSSIVRLIDPSRGEDRQVRIFMNHPLRYRGETFYQSSFLPDDRGTILQVVRNPGWILPYVACTLVSVGMLIQFCRTLVNFLGRRKAVAL